MYYEIEGEGKPLVYLPSAFGVAGLDSSPSLSENHAVITVDLQGHGRTADIPGRPIRFEQHARDVVGLLEHLGIERADFFGHSFGGLVAALIASRHAAVACRVATYGAVFGTQLEACKPEVLNPQLPVTPDAEGIRYQRENYDQVAPAPGYWPMIWRKVCTVQWDGFRHEELARIDAPVLVALGDKDVVRLEHAIDAFERMPHAELAVIPDAGHVAPLAEPEKIIPVVKRFLEQPAHRLPFATTDTGYAPGKTR